MKVKIFTKANTDDLEEDINKFLSERNVDIKDIKLSESATDGSFYTTAMVMYEEK